MTMRFAIPLLSSAIFSLAQAADDFSAGADQLGRRQYSAAAQSFDRWLAEHPRDADAWALSGMAHFHAGDRAAAVKALENARAGKSRYGARTLYYLGLSYSALGEDSKARDAYASLQRDYPSSPEAAKVDRTVAAEHPGVSSTSHAEPLTGFSRAASWFRFTTINDAGYDSNPSLTEDPSSLPAEQGRAFYFNYAALRFDVPKTPLFIEGTFDNRDYFGDDSNDYRSFRGRGGLDFYLGQAWKLTPRYEYERAYLDHSYFETRQQAALRISWISGHWQASLTPYGLHRTFSDLYSDLDGDEVGADMGVGYRFNDFFKLLRLAGTVDRRDARLDRLGYDEYIPRLQVRFGLPWRFDLDLIGAYRIRQYAEVSPTVGFTREDERISGTARLTRPLTSWLSLEASAEMNSNDSNIDVHDYDEQVYSGGFVIVL